MAGRNHFRGRGGQPHYPRNTGGGGGSSASVVGEGKLSSSSTSSPATKATEIASAATTNTTSSTTQQLLAKLRNSSISHPTQQIQLALYVPPTSVGAIIGRGGRTIINIQREAMKRSLGHTGSVRINVLGGNNASYFGAGGGVGSGIGGVAGSGNNGGDALLFGSKSLGSGSTGSDIATAWNDPSYHGNIDDNIGQHYDDSDNNDNWTPVIIRGDPVGAFAAVRQIIPLLVADSTNNNSNGGNNLSATSCIHDGIVLDVPIHWSKHNLLVGREGLTIAALSATYETRIMIPPPPPSSDRSGKNSMVSSSQAQHKSQQQQQQQQQQQLAGSGGGSSATSSTAPSNIIQLEGDNIDMVEQCLAKMLSIVTGEERWVPTGRRISVDEKKKMTSDAAVVEDDDIEQSLNVPTTSNEQDNVIANIVSGTKKDDGDKITTTTTVAVTNNNSTAEAVIIKIWEPFSKLSSNILNNGRIRKIQRKTNTIIRRKKLRFDDNVGIDGAALSGDKVVNGDEKDEDADDLDDDDADDAEEEDGGAAVASRSINDPQGNIEGVKSATAQIEKILGFEPGSSTIVDTTTKRKPRASTTLTSANFSHPANVNNDTETENSKKARKRTKRGRKGTTSTGDYENSIQRSATDLMPVVGEEL
ncbi:hypothetical protein ACHAWU_009028 [Discostella pseudostelligera]|uniref:K Homology domain-containing protein n=1 Tax=Discostella pseudostelligera TaxID=259834 RepID=A0ABD3MDI8_9STRA